MPKDTPSADTAPTKAEERKPPAAPPASAPDPKAETPAAPSSSTPAQAEPEKRTPAEWAAKRKLTKPRDTRLPQSTDWQHPSYAVADKLCGWSEHAYHFQAEADRFLLTEPDFVKAVRDAVHFPTMAPYAPAVTPTALPRFEGFEPAKSLKRKPEPEKKPKGSETKQENV